MRSIAIALVLFTATLTAAPRTALREVTFTITSATIQKFDPPRRSRDGKYSEALVLRLEIPTLDYESLPPSSAPFLYIGSHELRPIDFEMDRTRVVLTFHDPAWEKLGGGERMVLTTLHGDPVLNPDKYKDRPQFDPKMIGF